MIQPLMVKNSETGLAGKLKGIKRGESAAGAYPGESKILDGKVLL